MNRSYEINYSPSASDNTGGRLNIHICVTADRKQWNVFNYYVKEIGL